MAFDLVTKRISVDKDGKLVFNKNITIVNNEDFTLRVGEFHHEGLGNYTGFQADWRW